jgi:PAS domain S-box-containing protein
MQDSAPAGTAAKPADTTIRSRIAQLALLACCALVALVSILGWTIERTREANDRVQHTVSIRRALAEYTREVVGAESGQRGYLLTHQDAYLDSYNLVLSENKALFARLSELIGDSAERPKLQSLGAIFHDKFQELARTIRLARTGNRKLALALVLSGDGRRNTAAFQSLGKQIADDETRQLALSQAAADYENGNVLLCGGIGSILALVLIIWAARRTIAQIGGPLDHLMEGIAAFGHGDLDRRIDASSQDELGKVAAAFNDMADRMAASNRAKQVADEAVQLSEERLRSILNAVPDSIVKFDEFGRLEFFSAASTRLFGYSEAEMIGQNVRMLVPESFRALHDSFLAHLRETGEQRITLPDHAALGQRKDGTTFPIEWVVVETSGSPTRRFTGFMRDITRRHRIERELKDAKGIAEAANLAKTEFLSNMSHELRTPLNAILGFAQLIASDEPPPTPDQATCVGHILQSGWYLLSLVNEILDLSLIESGKLVLSVEPISVSELLDGCLAMMEPLAQQRGIAMAFPVFEHPCFVLADGMRLKQVVVNLISNAIKYNREDGSLSVQCFEPSPGWLRIAVTDTGMGLPPEKLAQLFQPFNRLGREAEAEQGTGIGLVVTKRLVDAMEGRIGVESEVGVGSVFHVDFAASVPPQAIHVDPHLTDLFDDGPPTISAGLQGHNA